MFGFALNMPCYWLRHVEVQNSSYLEGKTWCPFHPFHLLKLICEQIQHDSTTASSPIFVKYLPETAVFPQSISIQFFGTRWPGGNRTIRHPVARRNVPELDGVESSQFESSGHGFKIYPKCKNWIIDGGMVYRPQA